MSPSSTAEVVYRDQLARWTAAFGAARYEDLAGDLDEQSTPDGVRRFLVNSFGNRISWLLRESAFVGEAFENLPDLVQAYAHTVPRGQFEIAGVPDEEQFIGWLEATQPLTPVQRDFVTCQRGEFAVLTVARGNRAGHIAFQQRWRRSRDLAGQLGAGPAVRAHVNPIRFEGRLLTSVLIGEGHPLPADVVFFAAGTAVHTALLQGPEMAAFRDLAGRSPCGLDEWACGADRDDRMALARALADKGLVAFE